MQTKKDVTALRDNWQKYHFDGVRVSLSVSSFDTRCKHEAAVRKTVGGGYPQKWSKYLSINPPPQPKDPNPPKTTESNTVVVLGPIGIANGKEIY